MSSLRRVRVEPEEQLVYPLLDLDGGAYTGPGEMGVTLPVEVDVLLRAFQDHWQALQDAGYATTSEQERAELSAEQDHVEALLGSALAGTGWTLVERGQRTEEKQRRRRKSRRKHR